ATAAARWSCRASTSKSSSPGAEKPRADSLDPERTEEMIPCEFAIRRPAVACRLVAVALAAATMAVPSTRAAAHEPHHTVVAADTVQWGAAPPSLPAGAQAAVLLGSPAKEGPFVLRLKLPAE